MSPILTTAVTGLTNSASRIADAASKIVKASSTISANPQQTAADNGITEALVAIKTETAVYGANAKVIQTAEKLNKALINIKT